MYVKHAMSPNSTYRMIDSFFYLSCKVWEGGGGYVKRDPCVDMATAALDSLACYWNVLTAFGMLGNTL